MKDIANVLRPYYGWFKLAGLLFLVYKLWPMLSGLFFSVSAPVLDAVETVKTQAEDSHTKSLVKAVNPAATAADAKVFKADATAIAMALGNLPGSFANMLIPDRQLAFSTIKKYSKWIMKGAVPMVIDGKRMERKRTLQMAVLYPVYRDVTNGRSLEADLTAAFAGAANTTMRDIYNNYIHG